MTRINVRTKGASGEREMCKWLEKNLELDFLPERNLEQVRSGGGDIVDVRPFSFEVKRCAVLNLQNWWIQSKTAAKRIGRIPIVCFRQNRQPWEFLIPASFIGLELGFLRVDERVFKSWALMIMEKQLESESQAEE